MREAEASGAPLTVEKRVDPQRAVTEITLYTADHPGLFSRIAGALAVSGANIVDAKIMTMSNGMALDTFWVQDFAGGAVRPAGQARQARGHVRERADRRSEAAPRARTRPPAFPSRTQRLHRAAARPRRQQGERARTPSSRSTAATGPGLLFELTRELTRLNLQVSSAKISTYGEKVVDVFYVKDLFGHKVEHPQSSPKSAAPSKRCWPRATSRRPPRSSASRRRPSRSLWAGLSLGWKGESQQSRHGRSRSHSPFAGRTLRH